MEGKLSGAEEAEYAGLLSTIAQIERTLVFSPGDAGTVALLTRFVENAKGRLDALEREAKHNAEKEKTAAETNLQIAAAVEHEKALNEAERIEYAALLEHEYFTKAEFGKLEHFYSNSWDKLTDEGKDEMSQRVWGGVRQGEYKFTELPDPVKEKEAQRMEMRLGKSDELVGSLSSIPTNDRDDFMNARKQGNRELSYGVLDRPSFAQHAAPSEVRDTVKSISADTVKVLHGASQEPENHPLKGDAAPCMGSIKLELADIKLSDSKAGQQVPPLTGVSGNTKQGKELDVPLAQR